MAATMQPEAIKRVETKPDGSSVTVADKAVEDFIAQKLVDSFPDIPMVAEESITQNALTDSLHKERFFLVDPIDGTAAYVKGRDDYSVNIALIDNGRPVFGVIAAPALQELYWGGQMHGAWRRCGDNEPQGIRVRAFDPQAMRMIASRYFAREGQLHHLMHEDVVVEGVDTLSSSLKFCRIAEGRVDFYPRLGRTCEWDTAAGQAILEGAGGAVVERGRLVDMHYGGRKKTGDDLIHFYNPEFYAVSDRAILNFTIK